MLGKALRRVGRWLMRGTRRHRAYVVLTDLVPRLVGGRVLAGPARGLKFSGGDTAGYVLGLSEPAVQRALVAYLRPGDIYYDVGTHAGFLAVLAARLVGPSGQVHCFEPVVANVGVLRRNLEANGVWHAQVHQLALGDRNGEATMTGERNITARLGEGSERVRLARLDTLDLPAPHVLKIDVEGAEGEVLDGARSVLREHQPVVIVEIHSDEAREQVLRVLGECGYRSLEPIDDDGMPHLVARPE